jgi:hypothetical protein
MTPADLWATHCHVMGRAGLAVGGRPSEAARPSEGYLVVMGGRFDGARRYETLALEKSAPAASPTSSENLAHRSVQPPRPRFRPVSLPAAL